MVASVIVALAAARTALASEAYLGSACVRLFAEAGGEVLINACADCRRVGVERVRLGAHFPTARTVIVPEHGRIELSFLGPGRTLLTSDEGCRDAGSSDALASRSDGRRCVQFARSEELHLLVNGCGVCRSVAVQRTESSGHLNRGTFIVGPHAVVPYPADGAVSATLADEMPCS